MQSSSNARMVSAVFGSFWRSMLLVVLLVLSASAAFGCGGTRGTLLVLGAGGGGGASGASGSAGTSAGAPSVPWIPSPDITWQAQLSGKVDPSLNVQLFYIDVDLVPEATRSALKSAGRNVACYLSVGSFEPWRSDHASFPSELIGNPLSDFPREQWLDIRSPALRPIMQQRIAALAAARCDGIVPANLEGNLSDTGFSLSAADEHAYALWLNEQARAHGLSLALSLDESLVPELMADFDWALAFECVRDGCPGYGAMRQSGKTVLLIEYGNVGNAPATCAKANGYGLNTLIKNTALDAFRVSCSG